MNTLLPDRRSHHSQLHARQYGLVTLHQSRPGHAPFAGMRHQPAAILETPAQEHRIIPREIGVHDLLTFLGLDACHVTCDPQHRLPCKEIRLDGGATLYKQGQHVGQAFVILEGILARQQLFNAKATGLRGPSPIALSGEKELIGLHIGLSRRPETVTAVTQATVLALSFKTLQNAVPSSTLVNDLLMRTAGAALFRDWRVAYRLRDLPSFARTVAGLSHLAHLAGLKTVLAEADGTIALTLPLPCLATWLDMDLETMGAQLKRLERYGVMCTSANAIKWLDPIKLEALWSSD